VLPTVVIRAILTRYPSVRSHVIDFFRCPTRPTADVNEVLRRLVPIILAFEPTSPQLLGGFSMLFPKAPPTSVRTPPFGSIHYHVRLARPLECAKPA